MVTRSQARVAAIVDLVESLPQEEVTAVLDGLGIAQERRPEKHKDNRRCLICGFGWVGHQARASHPDDGHAWRPNIPPKQTTAEEATDEDPGL